MITIRTHNIFEDCFHIIAYAIMNNKTTSSYIELLDNIKSYIFDNRENKSSVNRWDRETIHCDLEFSIILAIKQVFPNIQIKLCL